MSKYIKLYLRTPFGKFKISTKYRIDVARLQKMVAVSIAATLFELLELAKQHTEERFKMVESAGRVIGGEHKVYPAVKKIYEKSLSMNGEFNNNKIRFGLFNKSVLNESITTSNGRQDHTEWWKIFEYGTSTTRDTSIQFNSGFLKDDSRVFKSSLRGFLPRELGEKFFYKSPEMAQGDWGEGILASREVTNILHLKPHQGVVPVRNIATFFPIVKEFLNEQLKVNFPAIVKEALTK